VGSGDVDGGLTSIQSPAIALPAGGTLTLRFRYYFAHNNNATTADYFRVRVVEVGGQPPQIVFDRRATGALAAGAWTTQSVNISSFAGKTVRLRFEAADAATGSIIEAGVDNVTVMRQ
jgi:aminopeptidase S